MKLRCLSITIVVLFLIGPAFPQQREKELFQQLRVSKPDSNRVKLWYALGVYYLNVKHEDKKADLQRAKSNLLNAFHLADSLYIGSGFLKYECLSKVAEVLVAENQPGKGRSLFLQLAKYYHDHNMPVRKAKTYQQYVESVWPMSNDFVDMHRWLSKALKIYVALKRPGDIIYTNYWIASVDLFKEKDNSYLKTEKRCLETIAKYEHVTKSNLGYLYSLLSRTNRYKGNLNKSLFYSLKGLQVIQDTKETGAAEEIYGELAQTYQDLGQTENSIVYYKKTIQLREKKNMPQEFLFRTAGFVAQGLIKLNKPVEALNFIESIEKRHKPDSKGKYAFIEQVKAYCYEALRDYPKAESAYLSMIRDYEKGGSEMWFRAEYDIARFYVQRKQFVKAIPFLHPETQTLNFSEAKDLEYLFFQVDSARGHFVSAMDHFKKYKMMNDSIFNSTKNKQIQELQIKYETDQKAKDIKILKIESVRQQNNVQRAQNQRNLTLCGIGILCVLIVALYKSYRANQTKNIALNQLVSEKDSILLEKDNLLAEKEWLLKEIHHRVKNNLQIVMGLLQRQSSYIDSDVALAAIQNSENRMHSIALIHQKLYQSDSLNTVYMPDYIGDFLLYLKDSGDLGNRILFEKQLDDISLNVSQAVPLGLILNEAVTNAIKHAYAEDEPGVIQVIFCRVNSEEYMLSIRDQGVGLKEGFIAEQADTMGMTLMRGLCKQLGGEFRLQSNGGVTISTTFK